ncbi:MAG: hypothetical protein M3405_14465 [Acidobacteriota bacterium]|jgi:hypothetical protein|nr:hypothetical protein [Acidobacteriota bacterium]
MPRPEVSSEEDIVRAIHKAWWDEKENRKNSSIFKGQNISVNRLSILSIDRIFEILHQQLDSSPNGIIIGCGEINVGKLKSIGEKFQNPTEIIVVEDSLPDNPAHAEIPQKITRGLAKAIIKELKFIKDENLNL